MAYFHLFYKCCSDARLRVHGPHIVLIYYYALPIISILVYLEKTHHRMGLLVRFRSCDECTIIQNVGINKTHARPFLNGNVLEKNEILMNGLEGFPPLFSPMYHVFGSQYIRVRIHSISCIHSFLSIIIDCLLILISNSLSCSIDQP